MDRAHRRRLRWLVSGRWDPRRGLGPVRGHADWLMRGTSFGGELGGIILMLITAPIWLPFAFAGYVIAGAEGAMIGAAAPLCVGALSFIGPSMIRKRLTAACQRDGFLRCPWCRHDLRGLEDRRCPECGAGVDPDACVTLYEMAYRSYKPDPKVIKRRELWAWARSLRERSRG